MTHSTDVPASYDFILSRSRRNDSYGLWRLDLASEALLQRVPTDPEACFDRRRELLPIGRYLLEWGPLEANAYAPFFPYRLFELDPTSKTPLSGKIVQQGTWSKKKFWQRLADFGNPHGGQKAFDSDQHLQLLPFGNFVLNLIPSRGRGTFQLWNFDPSPMQAADPLPGPYSPQGSFDNIDIDHELLPIGNYMLDWIPGTGEFCVWSMDPQSGIPLAAPAVRRGRWSHFGPSHRLLPIGEHVLSWVPGRSGCEVWRFVANHAEGPLIGPISRGTLPADFDEHTTLTAIQPLIPIDAARQNVPGTIDFMRTRIKHVVYYMLENRSFDHLCGWLYERNEAGIHFIGTDGPFDGASTKMRNPNPGALSGEPPSVSLSQYLDGKVDAGQPLEFLDTDPYHDKSDVLRQLFYANRNGYEQRSTPDMTGFVWNNSNPDVMITYTPAQVPVLNGLARNFAISDAWFCSMPGPTDPNRAFAFTGSSLGELNNFQNGAVYTNWPATSHRPSMWKVLWTNGFTDWKLYNSVEWMHFVHTYQLFLSGQIPTVDANQGAYIAGIDQFKADARAGKLPAFSFLEPAWISFDGTSSYHPGADLVPGERALNEIYEALKAGPAWNETLLVITFDEHGGIYDHVPPPYTVNPWPNDVIDGFRFDLMGVRVPTILVSPLIESQTVFRSPTSVAYDSTSFMATLLQWYGIPRSRWGLGDRIHQAPSFEGVLSRSSPRQQVPTLTPPHDRNYPREAGPRITDLQRLMVPRIVSAIAGARLGAERSAQLAEEILAKATDAPSLHALLAKLER